MGAVAHGHLGFESSCPVLGRSTTEWPVSVHLATGNICFSRLTAHCCHGEFIGIFQTHGCGSKPMGSHFGVGEFTTHLKTYFGGDWDVHWGYDFDFDPWPHCFAELLKVSGTSIALELRRVVKTMAGIR